jgi:hypothetical protein
VVTSSKPYLNVTQSAHDSPVLAKPANIAPWSVRPSLSVAETPGRRSSAPFLPWRSHLPGWDPPDFFVDVSDVTGVGMASVCGLVLILPLSFGCVHVPFFLPLTSHRLPALRRTGERGNTTRDFRSAPADFRI